MKDEKDKETENLQKEKSFYGTLDTKVKLNEMAKPSTAKEIMFSNSPEAVGADK